MMADKIGERIFLDVASVQEQQDYGNEGRLIL